MNLPFLPFQIIKLKTTYCIRSLFTIGFVVSSLGVHLSNTKKAAGRRLSALKENAARAFGITRNESDHHQLQQMQLRRASAIGGQTKVGEA